MIYLYWIFGIIGYLCIGVLTTLIIRKMDDPIPDEGASVLGALWPMVAVFCVILLPFWVVSKGIEWVARRLS